MINVAERANTTDLKIFQMVGSALMAEVNILKTGQSTVIHVMNGKEENNESKVSGRV